MSREVLDRLRDIVRSAELARLHAGGLDAVELASSAISRDSALYRIAIIGEAISHLPPEVQALAPEIPWVRAKDMRHHIVHGYWQVDLAIVADTIANDLDPLESAANRLIDLLSHSNP